MIDIFDMSKFDKLMNSIFADGKGDHLMTTYNLRYFYKIFRLLVIGATITYCVAGIWFLLCMQLIKPKYNKENNYNTFIDAYDLTYEKSSKTNLEK